MQALRARAGRGRAAVGRHLVLPGLEVPLRRRRAIGPDVAPERRHPRERMVRVRVEEAERPVVLDRHRVVRLARRRAGIGEERHRAVHDRAPVRRGLLLDRHRRVRRDLRAAAGRTSFWRRVGRSSTPIPASAAVCARNGPVAMTTASAATSPRVVRTPRTRSPSTTMSWAPACVTNVAPPPGVASGMRRRVRGGRGVADRSAASGPASRRERGIERRARRATATASERGPRRR